MPNAWREYRKAGESSAVIGGLAGPMRSLERGPAGAPGRTGHGYTSAVAVRPAGSKQYRSSTPAVYQILELDFAVLVSSHPAGTCSFYY